MMTRELQPIVWAHFFDCFSRQNCGRTMTVDVMPAPDARAYTVARRLPLLGITAEPRRGQPELIQVMLGGPDEGNVSHVIPRPARVRVAQVTNGEDEMLIIESESG